MSDEIPQENTSVPLDNTNAGVNLTDTSVENRETNNNMELYHPHKKHHVQRLPGD